jgi:hypothetical protein
MNIHIATTFPKGKNKPKQGQPTGFKAAILNGTKKHTIRENADFWEKRLQPKQVKGAPKGFKARPILNLVEWSGKPYRSTCEHIAQRIQFTQRVKKQNGEWYVQIAYTNKWFAIDKEILAENDGLTVEDFTAFFAHVPDGKEMIIIHFANAQYDLYNSIKYFM